jgi:hypothetical protein
MAFPSQNPRPFTRASIEALNPNQIGVYGIYHQYKWVYVGKGDIRTRLLAHMNDPKIQSTAPRITSRGSRRTATPLRSN